MHCWAHVLGTTHQHLDKTALLFGLSCTLFVSGCSPHGEYGTADQNSALASQRCCVSLTAQSCNHTKRPLALLIHTTRIYHLISKLVCIISGHVPRGVTHFTTIHYLKHVINEDTTQSEFSNIYKRRVNSTGCVGSLRSTNMHTQPSNFLNI